MRIAYRVVVGGRRCVRELHAVDEDPVTRGSVLRVVPAGIRLGGEAARYGFDRLIPFPAAVPDRAAAITTRWLEDMLDLPRGAITGVDVVDHHDGTASRVRLTVDADPDAGVPGGFFIKLAPRSFGGRFFMNAMGLGEREARFYGEVGRHVPVRIPRCFGIAVDRRRGRNAIILEDLSERAQFRDITQSCDVDEARAVVEALADLHAMFWASNRFADDLAWLRPRHDTPAAVLVGALVRRVIERPTGMVAEIVPPDVQRSSRVLVQQGQRNAAYWASQPLTLAHNDTHLGNLFFENAVPGFLDWQNVAVGPGIRDVAYFIVPSLAPATARAVERELVASYATRLTSRGIDVDESLLWQDYRAAASQYFVGAVVTGAFGARLQREHIARTGIERAVAAVRDLDSFELLRELAVVRSR